MSNQSQTSTDSEQQYGLPDVRDPDTGEVADVEYEFEWNGVDVPIVLRPPTLDEQQKYEDMGTDVDVDQLREIVERHIIKPESPPDGWTVREVTCYLEGVMRYSTEGGSDLAQAARDELAQRDTPGN